MVDSRQKGAAFERELCAWLKELVVDRRDAEGKPYAPRRNLEQYQVADRGDVILGDWCFEAKRYARGHWHRAEWWDQVLTASEAESKKPCLVYKFDRCPWRFVFRFDAVSDRDWGDSSTLTVSAAEAGRIILEGL